VKKKICFIAQFPPPIHGLSKAVDTLYNSELKNKFIFEKVDITDNKRFLKNILLIMKSDADLFYFTISQSIGGNIRDLIIIKCIQLKQKKCLIHLHGGYFRDLFESKMGTIQKKMNKNILSKVSGAIVLGESLKHIFAPFLPNEKIHVVKNCVDDEYLMSSQEFLDKLKQNKKKIKDVLYLSNFIESKGYLKVLEMANIEKTRCYLTNSKNPLNEKNFHFHFAGAFFKEEDRKMFFEYIKNNSLEDFITFYGVIDGKNKMSLLKKCDIFTLITRYPIEGQPISILEAMGNGMIIITTDHAGIPDIVRNGINGLVLGKSEDIQSIFLNLEQLDSKEICIENRKEILKNHLQKKYIENMRIVFNSCLIS